MCRIGFVLFCLCASSIGGRAQEAIRNYIFGHSLIHHEIQVNPTPSQETSVPHWLYFLAEAGGHTYAVDGQYGFLLQHAQLPPQAQWGFDAVPGVWDSDTQSFGEADFTDVLFTPANFIQWQPVTENYPGEDTSPLAATHTILDWCAAREPDIRFHLYENWPDMAPYLNGDFPPSASEWQTYNDYLQGDFHDWFLTYHDSLRLAHPDLCVTMLPVGPIISQLLLQPPFDAIPLSELYEDDAPHGRPTLYFLAALVTYMGFYGEPAPIDYEVPAIIHQVVREHYATAVDMIWEEMASFTDATGESRAFCDGVPTPTRNVTTEEAVRLVPNPTQAGFTILTSLAYTSVQIRDLTGRIVRQDTQTAGLAAGSYVVVLLNEAGGVLAVQPLVVL